MNVWFEMCVNDDDGNGQHTGRLRAAQFQLEDYSRELHLDCVYWREMTCRHLNDNQIRVGRRTFPILHYETYVGNMAWDAALVTPEVANQIASLLRYSEKYEPSDGTTELWEAWEDGAALFAEVQHG